MARKDEDREDLLAEATALVERAEFTAPGFAEPIVAGFRRDGSVSVFFGGDPVYQFNSLDQLRRAFVAGLIYKADRHRLATLRRERTGQGLELLRHDLTGLETKEFLARLDDGLARLRQALAGPHCEVLGQIPADQKVIERLQDWLRRLPAPVAIAASPRSR